MTEIPEISYKRRLISDDQKELERLRKRIIDIENRIKITHDAIAKLELEKELDGFVYDSLRDGKIRDTNIKHIIIYGCQCIEGDKCDGTHKIHIYDMTNERRINFNNQHNFSILELENLNYIDKISQYVDDGYDSARLRARCEFFKRYPNKIVEIWTGC